MKLRVRYAELVNGEMVMREMVVGPKAFIDCSKSPNFWYTEGGCDKKMKAENVVSIEAIED